MSSITIWNRLEPRARSLDMSAGLAARVHDPLWLLARQWQLGEFAGRDGGSPVTVTVKATTAALDRFAVGVEGAGVAYDGTRPLETLVEEENVRPASAAADGRQAVEAGLHFARLLDAAGLARLRPLYLAQYPLAALTDATDAAARQFFALVAGRVIDGIKLYADITGVVEGLPGAPSIANADAPAVLAVVRQWRAWYEALFDEAGQTDAWQPARMEYAFAAGVAGDTGSFVAREYDGGALDWHAFNSSSVAIAGGTTQPVTTTRQVMAAPVAFRGMPARRFWEIEDASVDLASLTAGAEDLGRLLLRDFALIYGNDWFQIPWAVPVGVAVGIDSLAVADTFGVTTPLPHYAVADGAAGRWRMFALSTNPTDATAPDHRLLVLPSAAAVLDSMPVEDVLLLRDETADMVWGVENRIVGSAGLPLDRALTWRTNAPTLAPPATDQPPRYRLGSVVPDYWYPFLPVGEGSGGHLQVRRGSVPTSPSRPLGRLFGSPELTLFLDEIPREGVRLERRFRYARGLNGSSHLWVGRRRLTGRGTSRTGLSFDYLET